MKKTPENSFDILQLPPSANRTDIRRAYKRLVRQYPPEQFPEDFARINAAHQALIEGTELTETKDWAIYCYPLQFVQEQLLNQEANPSDDVANKNLQELLKSVPESIFNVNFELEQQIKAELNR